MGRGAAALLLLAMSGHLRGAPKENKMKATYIWKMINQVSIGRCLLFFSFFFNFPHGVFLSTRINVHFFELLNFKPVEEAWADAKPCAFVQMSDIRMDDAHSSDDDDDDQSGKTSDVLLALCLQKDQLGIAVYDCLTTTLSVGQIYCFKANVESVLKNLKCQVEPKTMFVERKMITNPQMAAALRRPAMVDQPNEADQENEDKKIMILPKSDFDVRTVTMNFG
jgi:hypothetical protein